ncbi:putative hexokinase [Tripterygium wilfordii]|uniref:Phosphotransferase n=1 Tax=Tripterygium wilfordii TaxID=458696 RepID=A0A7J7CVC0_TRIWF|nr:probable hexokinase-like 2 protein isoform X1 [Tripterygium wilfordii]KAF5738062.1 putative hexokinase [Tripterygium wilfordii]
MRKEALVVVAATAATAVVGITLFRRWQRRKERQWKGTHGILRKLARECATPVSKLWEVANDLVSEMEASLASQETFSTTLNMLVSYMASLPSGDEEGVYYGVNLRGTNFLILCARLGGKQKPISDLYREEIIIPSDVVTGTSQELFDFIAVEVEKFVSANPENRDTGGAEEKKLGFTWSYPVDQAAATSGSAIKWKSFSVDDTVGKALLNDLNRALQKHGVNMHVFALVDNAVGELAGGRYYNRDSVAAITLGMSTDAAYIEAAETVHKWCSPLPESGEMVISMELGNFKSPHLPVTEFDASLDAESSNPGSGVFEKLVAGMYLGEIVRRVLLKMAQETGIFGENVPSKLATPFLLRSPDMAVMHQDTSEDHDGVDEKLNEIFGITNSSPMARELVAEVCDIVAERSARLAGAGIVGIIKKLGRIENKKSVVTIEGGLYEHYRVFRNYLHSSVWEMLGNDLSDNVRIEHSHGGPGAGAVFLAASANLNS